MTTNEIHHNSTAALDGVDDDDADGGPHCFFTSQNVHRSDDPDVALTENIILALHELLLSCAAACAPFTEQVTSPSPHTIYNPL